MAFLIVQTKRQRPKKPKSFIKCFLIPVFSYGYRSGKNVNKEELTAISSRIEDMSITKMTDDFAGLSKLVPDIEAHLKTMDVQNKWEKESTTTIKKSVKICGINLFQTEKIIHTPQGRQFLAAKNKQLERQIQELVEQETQMNQDYQKFCDAINEELGTAKTGIRDHEINQDAMKLKKPLLDEAVDLKTKKKKYRLRGRSSETAKAHRG
eukprot:TRINITY_DN608_c0_g2_i7.p1 TRINITY_DN608_c0_g2~~TRINITY_DN608_c0_g2_i7.p1  ORF type:complete len:209 (-),score=60.61 TRINITY_DN608_c0_g2_i7:2-628(-)